MKIELTKEEIGILNECLLMECLEIGKAKTNPYIDLKQIAKKEIAVMQLMNKINS